MNHYQHLTSGILAVFLYGCAIPVEEQSKGIDEDSTLPFWQISADGVEIRLVQRLPMQTRGYFLARGFNRKHAEVIAQSCVFQTIIKNTARQLSKNTELEYRLDDWQVIQNGQSSRIKLREHWANKWRAENVPKPAQIAFEWSLLPTIQHYNAGDYNWGMTMMGISPGSYFDLKVSWTRHGKKRLSIIKNMQCAEDINPQPAGAM